MRPRTIGLTAWGAVACAVLTACSTSTPSNSASVSTSTTAPIATLAPAPTTTVVTTAPFSDPRSVAPSVPQINTTVPRTDAPTSPPATTPAETTPTTARPTNAAACLAKLPVTFKAGQLVWPSVQGEDLVKQTPQFAAWGVGGAVVMTYPASANGDQLQAFKNAGKVPLLLATDEEGGIVQRFKRVGVLPIPATVPATMTPSQIEQIVSDHAAVLKALGIDVVYGPVVDVSPLSGDGPIGNRAFSNDPSVVSTYAQAYINGWESAGITPVIKHFPGHGSASADSHKATATTPSLSALKQRDLLPYTDLVNSGAGVMVGHLTVPGLTDAEGVPASLSKAAITGLLRNQLGFKDTLVFTDALGMQAVAVQFKVPVAAERAIIAGADVAIFTSTADAPDVIIQLVAAVRAGRLSAARLDNAVSHVLRTKGIDPCSISV